MDARLDPYRELGVPAAAYQADIANAYHHPPAGTQTLHAAGSAVLRWPACPR